MAPSPSLLPRWRRVAAPSLLIAMMLTAAAAQAPAPAQAGAPPSAATTTAAVPAVSTESAAPQTAATITPTAAAVTATQPTAGSTRSAASARMAEAQAQAAALRQQILALPALEGTGIDTAARGKDILAHLGAVLRLYRMALTPVQKVGEPSDVLYQEQAVSDATDMATYAFASARTEAALLSKVPPRPGAKTQADQEEDSNATKTPSESEKLAAANAAATQRLKDLQAEDTILDRAPARGQDLATLQQRREQIDGELKLQTAIRNTLNRVASFSDAQNNSSGLTGDIDRLQRSTPELVNSKPKPIVPPVLENLSAARDAGVSSQAAWLFQLLSTKHSIDQLVAETDALHSQALDLRTPLIKILRTTIRESQAATAANGGAPAPPVASTTSPAANQGSAAAPAGGANSVIATRRHFDTLTATFNVLSEAVVPLSQEILILESNRANLLSWRAAVDAEYSSILRSLLLRVLVIAIALGVLFLLSEIWRRATQRYVHDVRRRRQLLVVRRLVVGFFSGIVVIFGFVTQFNSLATFAGFITAGIAVGLQTILLSVAAYFFIVGRYGVRVGDRITVAGVTGDVIEVGLVRFYIAELAGTGNELHSTGRVAVFSNSVLFQAGTPLYKQMPGTEYAWHELTVKLNEKEDHHPATEAIAAAVNGIFATYKARIDEQHKRVEIWMDAAIAAPAVESRLQLSEAGLQFAVLFPVEIRDAAEVDEKITEALLTSLNGNEAARKAIASAPVIKASIKG